jgi:hypothetical protein
MEKNAGAAIRLKMSLLYDVHTHGHRMNGKNIPPFVVILIVPSPGKERVKIFDSFINSSYSFKGMASWNYYE